MSDAREHSAGSEGEHVPKPLDRLPAAGPLGRLLRAQFAETPDPNSPKKQRLQEKKGKGPRLQVKNAGEGSTGLEQANSLILLRQAAFVNTAGPAVELPTEAEQALLRWAQSPAGGTGSDARGFSHGLGQETDRLKHVADRRTYAMHRLKKQGKSVVRVHLTPEWRMIVGHGERGNAYEIGMALHGTYGWPVIPGSGLKGLAAAFVRARADDLRTAEGDDSGADSANQSELTDLTESYREIFRTELPTGKAEKRREERKIDRVRFLDALPDGKPATVEIDVLTPHEKPYYDNTISEKRNGEYVFPGEHHQPVPVQFLTITEGTFVADLVGDDIGLTRQAACWLEKGADLLGVGTKTAAGYGYMTPIREEL